MSKKRLVDAIELANFFGFMRKMWSGSEIMDVIHEAETVDAVEVVHGRWEKPSKYGLSDKFDGMGAVCSACADYCDNLYNYCPNCGAKMDGDENG